jgi:hypothetical protein
MIVAMAMTTVWGTPTPPVRRHRRHGDTLEHVDRRALERAGWRTVLEYREDHVRARDGRLLQVATTWIAEAERADGCTAVLTAAARSPEDAWARLRAAAEAVVVRPVKLVRS